eukprot:176604-Prymnesium_polylepis.1
MHTSKVFGVAQVARDHLDSELLLIQLRQPDGVESSQQHDARSGVFAAQQQLHPFEALGRNAFERKADGEQRYVRAVSWGGVACDGRRERGLALRDALPPACNGLNYGRPEAPASGELLHALDACAARLHEDAIRPEGLQLLVDRAVAV